MPEIANFQRLETAAAGDKLSERRRILAGGVETGFSPMLARSAAVDVEVKDRMSKLFSQLIREMHR